MTTITPTISPSASQRSQLDSALFGRNRVDTKIADFRAVLGQMDQRPNESPEDLARRSAENFVAIAFLQPLIKQLRDTNQAAPPFAPTEGEKTFRGLMDAQLAQNIVARGRFPIVDHVVKSMLDRARSASVNAEQNSGAKPA